MKKKIVCVGMLNCDAYYYGIRPEDFAVENSTYTQTRMSAGGDALNVSIDFSKMGFDAYLVGKTGMDFEGDGVVKTLENAGVNTSYVKRSHEYTTTKTLIIYTDQAKDANDRHCFRNKGANASLSFEDIDLSVLDGASHLHYGSYGPLENLDGEGGARLLKEAKARGLTTSLDIKGTGRDYEKLKQMLPYVDYFIPNFSEIESMTGLHELAKIRDEFQKLGVGVLCLKMAEQGVYITDFKEEFQLPTLITDQSEIKDLMGAGDAFCAGFSAASLMGYSLKERGVIASRCSMLALKSSGGSTWGIPFDKIAANELG